MDLMYQNLSVVILAENHNVTILHPRFLTEEGIVPKDWEVTDGPVCTPVMSAVGYNSKVDFLVEERKFSVTEKEPAFETEASIASQLASRYIEKLPYVNYKALGLNLQVFVPVENAANQYLERFFKRGPWWTDELLPLSFDLTFSYTRSYGMLNIKVRPAKLNANEGNGGLNGLVIDINCHADVVSLAALRNALGRTQDTLNDAVDTARAIVQ